ncbi:MAG: glycosyltransferase family 9 protein [Polaromonas sp.]|nr:glycosyltransferase family 9 protein [Polaromonas sp.]
MKRILVVATRQIGDVLLTTPLIRAARERWPESQIEVVGFSGTLGILRGNPDINRVIELPLRLGWSGFRALTRQIWRRYDLALITQPGDRAHLIGWIAARTRSGIVPAEGKSNWLKRSLLAHAVESAGDRGKVHVVAEKLSLLTPWLDTARSAPRVVLPTADALPNEVEAQLTPDVIVIHVPSMWSYKQWPVQHYRLLAGELLDRGWQIILTGSASARDRECIAPLLTLASAPQLLDLSGQLDFNQLATLFGKAKLYIGPDTSVSHLAAAAGLPVIAIFGPTNPLRWRPWPAEAPVKSFFVRRAPVQSEGNVTVLQEASMGCVPCGRAGCDDHLQSRSDCLQAITPQRVLTQALAELESNSQNRA